MLTFVVSIFTARYLGPNNFGLINYATAFTTFFASLCNLGIDSIIIKNFVDHPEEEGKAIGSAIVLRAASSMLSAVMIVGIVSIVDDGEPATILVAFLSSIGLFFQIFDTFKYWFQARLQSKYVVMATVISHIIVSSYKLVLLVTRKNVAWFAMATSVDYAVMGVFLMAAYRKNGGPKLTVSWGKAKELLYSGRSFVVAGMMVSIYAVTDKLMLKHMLDEASVAYYSLAVSLSTTWTFVLQAIIDSMYPSVLWTFDKEQDAFCKMNRQMYAIVIYMATTVSFAISFLAEPIVKSLYGTAYIPAVRPLRIVVWYTAFSYLGVARNAWVVCMNRQRYLKYLYFSAAVFNIGLNLLLIPLLGPSGAAAASLITQISTTVLLPALIPQLRPNAKLMLEALLLKDVLPGNKK